MIVTLLYEALPALSTLLQPLDELNQAKSKWHCTRKREADFQRSKELILQAPVLCHYDASKPLKLPCDVSLYGLGAVSCRTRQQTDKRLPLRLPHWRWLMLKGSAPRSRGKHWLIFWSRSFISMYGEELHPKDRPQTTGNHFLPQDGNSRNGHGSMGHNFIRAYMTPYTVRSRN